MCGTPLWMGVKGASGATTMTMSLFVFLVVAVAAVAAAMMPHPGASAPTGGREDESLRRAWADFRPSHVEGLRDDGDHALLFSKCTLSADRSVLNKIQCNGDTTVPAIGCLDTRVSYRCDPVTWTWKTSSQ